MRVVTGKPEPPRTHGEGVERQHIAFYAQQFLGT